MIKINELMQYYRKMYSSGKKITQDHINRFLDMQDRDGFDTENYRNGGNCVLCGEPFRLSKIDNVLAKYEWYLPNCVCDVDSKPIERNGK